MNSSTGPAPGATVQTGAPTSAAADLTRSLTRQALLVAGVCVFADAVQFLYLTPASTLRPHDWAIFVVIAVADAALALPARFSGWVAGAHAVVQLAAATVTVGTDAAQGVGTAGFLIAGYRAGAWLSGATAWAALAALIVSTVGVSLIYGGTSQDLMVVDVASNALLPWLVGRYTTARRGYIAELEQQAETQRRDALAAVDQAVREERSSIARDLHDVISHHVSAIGVHAGAARMRLTAAMDPRGTRESLSAVELSSRAAMSDLRRLLDVLHGDPADRDRVGLENIEDLLDGVRRAGLPTHFASEGVPRPVSDSAQLALYRITQEMLTNAGRYGDGRTVEVSLRFDSSMVSIGVCNGIDPLAAKPFTAPYGHRLTPRGLSGIRKRAALFGGTVAYGPDADGHRWETTVTFPLADSP